MKPKRVHKPFWGAVETALGTPRHAFKKQVFMTKTQMMSIPHARIKCDDGEFLIAISSFEDRKKWNLNDSCFVPLIRVNPDTGKERTVYKEYPNKDYQTGFNLLQAVI